MSNYCGVEKKLYKLSDEECNECFGLADAFSKNKSRDNLENLLSGLDEISILLERGGYSNNDEIFVLYDEMISKLKDVQPKDTIFMGLRKSVKKRADLVEDMRGTVAWHYLFHAEMERNIISDKLQGLAETGQYDKIKFDYVDRAVQSIEEYVGRAVAFDKDIMDKAGISVAKGYAIAAYTARICQEHFEDVKDINNAKEYELKKEFYLTNLEVAIKSVDVSSVPKELFEAVEVLKSENPVIETF